MKNALIGLFKGSSLTPQGQPKVPPEERVKQLKDTLMKARYEQELARQRVQHLEQMLQLVQNIKKHLKQEA